jgi:ketosteroid isomerase-like protein
MKKMNGFNIMLFVFIISLISILSCSKNSKNQGTGILLQTDRDFSDLSVREGMFKAFLYYIAEDGVILRNNSFPARGKETLAARFSGKTDTTFILSWEPLFENISASGDIGYTYGIHTNTDRLTGEKTRGTYVTIWQKQKNGNWKFVLDTGTQGLPNIQK